MDAQRAPAGIRTRALSGNRADHRRRTWLLGGAGNVERLAVGRLWHRQNRVAGHPWATAGLRLRLRVDSGHRGSRLAAVGPVTRDCGSAGVGRRQCAPDVAAGRFHGVAGDLGEHLGAATGDHRAALGRCGTGGCRGRSRQHAGVPARPRSAGAVRFAGGVASQQCLCCGLRARISAAAHRLGNSWQRSSRPPQPD